MAGSRLTAVGCSTPEAAHRLSGSWLGAQRRERVESRRSRRLLVEPISDDQRRAIERHPD